MRDLAEILDKMKTLMPPEHHQYIDWHKNDLLYRAPEQQKESWMKVQLWLLPALGVGIETPPLVIEKGDEWKAEVLSLWADKTIEQMTAEGLFEWRLI